MDIYYLEIVTPDVEGVCAAYAQTHGTAFGDGDPALGGARTARLSSGNRIGVRAPMHEMETSVVRPYALVEDIQSAVDAAAKAGATVALPPMELPGHGTCAIVIQGETEMGFWQV